jgi:hypothetical protein
LGGIKPTESKDCMPFFNVDSIDSRPTVNQLASAVGKKQATYVFAHKINATDHFGRAPIREWLDGAERMNIV